MFIQKKYFSLRKKLPKINNRFKIVVIIIVSILISLSPYIYAKTISSPFAYHSFIIKNSSASVQITGKIPANSIGVFDKKNLL